MMFQSKFILPVLLLVSFANVCASSEAIPEPIDVADIAELELVKIEGDDFLEIQNVSHSKCHRITVAEATIYLMPGDSVKYIGYHKEMEKFIGELSPQYFITYMHDGECYIVNATSKPLFLPSHSSYVATYISPFTVAKIKDRSSNYTWRIEKRDKPCSVVIDLKTM